MTDVRELKFEVIPAPDSNDHEVRIWIDGSDFLKSFAPNMLGMDPDDLLEWDILAPNEEPHEAIIARCGCGVVGCGDASVTISLDDEKAIWDSWSGDLTHYNPGTLKFKKDTYLKAIRTALNDHSWETPDRTAARILKSLVSHSTLSVHRFKYQWASGRIKDGEFTISLLGPLDFQQTLLHIPWQSESPSEIAEKAAAILAKDPIHWQNVTLYGK